VAGATAGLMWLAAVVLPIAGFRLPGRGVLAIALTAAGLSVGLVAFFQFRRAGTTVHPLRPQESSVLVVGGIYRVTRNPMYLGMLLILAAWAAWLANAAAFALLPCFVAYMRRFQIAPEERALEARFRQAFVDYRGAVRRWL
jgi:protein-S-isoprenylcysteine O-methyltransferase Ste14